MAHDAVVPVSVNPDIVILGETPVKDGAEHSVGIRQAAYTMDHVVWFRIIRPGAIVYLLISGLRRRDKSEVPHHGAIVHYHMPIPLFNIPEDNLIRGVTVYPLIGIAYRSHDFPRGLKDHAYCRKVFPAGYADVSDHEVGYAQ